MIVGLRERLLLSDQRIREGIEELCGLSERCGKHKEDDNYLRASSLGLKHN